MPISGKEELQIFYCFTENVTFVGIVEVEKYPFQMQISPNSLMH
jgi:hypothetical protein